MEAERGSHLEILVFGQHGDLVTIDSNDTTLKVH